MKKILLGFACSTMLATTAAAGGFSRGTADTDILFEEENFAMRAGVTIVNPTRKFTVNANPALVGVDGVDSYVIPSGAIKLGNEMFGCAGTVAQPFGGSVTYPSPLASGKLAESFTVTEYGLTCAYNFDVGPGFLSLIGGAFLEQFNYSLTTALGTTTTLNDDQVGYRAGVAYSVPEIALRAQLMYRSGSTYDPTGTTTIGGVTAASASGAGSLPQSVELDFQTGIAPGWLAFGSVKWTDWSVLDQLTLNAGLFTTQNQYFYTDGWTVSAGLGHQVNEAFSVFGAIQWDQGVGTGFDIDGDRWVFGAGGTISAGNSEIRLAASYTFLEGVAETQYGALNSAVDDGHAIGVSASLKVAF